MINLLMEHIEQIVVTPVFDENVGEINKLATFILGLYGLAENEDIDDIKN